MYLNADNDNIDLLRDFLGISHWESVVAIIIFFAIITALSIFIKKTKIKFPIRIFIGLSLGLVFGISIQAITGFNNNNITNPILPGNVDPPVDNPNYIEWAGQTARWVELIKNIFITGITMLTVPIVFLAIARISAKKLAATNKLVKMSISGIAILLVNVAVAFCIAFGLGMVFKIGQNFQLSAEGSYDKTSTIGLPALIAGYIPNSFIGIFTQFLIIPVIILGALVGYAIKKLTKRNEAQMDKARNSLEIMWKIIISILTMFIKIMPFAVMSMLASAIINQPIARLGDIGIIIGVAYLALVITFIWHLLTLYLFGVNPWEWLKKAQRPIVTGFTSQSSNAALPIALDSLKNDLKVEEEVSDTIMPLSTTIGLSGCAGVQAGIILSFLWFSVINQGDFPQWTIALLFINGLIITLIASLGIAGVPGTAAVVTAGVLGGLGFGGYYASVYGIIGALDGLFDMGRTAVNISGGLQATSIVARQNDMIDDDKLNLKNYPFKPLYLLNKKYGKKIEKRKAKQKSINDLRSEYQVKINEIKLKNNEHKTVEIKKLKLELRNKIKVIKTNKK
ncbi:dicarboxylate/amino acid:cation symporter [Spiroplasma platyhelix]|uniref:L-cystine uptake protein TcyP n=1 Tax=Spiroplasma platyhelix PALS-1 TaxID=1276218 RepID=A0A846TSJ2_9MOLU|nr:dicarboxylate/amino acid:cation symporter [Spiroplasma platyhelix]MBE4704105.1 C4-dicarboxylate transport protein [Spiroplasma platyhelix PALS-1]NKE38475.1 dicarboxylate/amino acid:cation symporter [Spiroplasma platyhelix PALS-1]UJB29363.1 proton/glutamate symporter [Spiroplasma platyhelix PALS-1]